MGKVYFASDFHLGADVDGDSSKEREKRICRWLDEIKQDAEHIYIVGDIFDFWFEYRHVVPKGFIRLQAKFLELRDMGIPIDFFIGNHDMWMFDYFEKELGIPVHRKPIIREIKGKRFFIAHGDGLGPEDFGYKMIKKVFANKLCQWLFGWLHPDIGISLANFWSGTSRKKQGKAQFKYTGKDKEWLIAYCERKIKSLDVDFFLFGHRHIPIDYRLSDGKTRYINAGEWMFSNSYVEFDGENLQIRFFENENGTIIQDAHDA